MGILRAILDHQFSLSDTLLVLHIPDPAVVKSLLSPSHSPARSRNGFTPRFSFSSLRSYLFSILLRFQPFLQDAPPRNLECTWLSPMFTRGFLPSPLDSQRMGPPSGALLHDPSSCRLLFCWGAPRFLVLAGPFLGGPPTGPARAAGPMPPPYTGTARQGSELRAARGPSHLGRRDHEFCV